MPVKNFRTHNPYSINNPIISYYSTLTLYEQQLYHQKRIEIAKLKSLELKNRENLINNESQLVEYIFSSEIASKNIIKTNESETSQRQIIEHDFFNISKKIDSLRDNEKKQIDAKLKLKANKLATEAQKKEQVRISALKKQFQTKIENLLEKEEKSRSNIYKELEKSSDFIINEQLKSLLLNTKGQLENFSKNNKKNYDLPELFININLICNVFKKIIPKITKYKNISELIITDIYLLQEANWYLNNFGERIIKIAEQNSITSLENIRFGEIIKNSDIFIDKILTKLNIDTKFHDNVKFQINMFVWLDKTYELLNLLNKTSPDESPSKNSFTTLFNSIEKVYHKKSSKDIHELNKAVLEHILGMQQSLNLTAEGNQNIKDITCDSFWEYFYNLGLDLAYVYHKEPRTSLKALLIQSCQSGTPFSFNIYLNRALKSEINLDELFTNEKFNFLHLACKLGKHEIVASLLSHNVDINIKSGEGLTGFHYACIKGHEKVVRLFINRDVKINDYVKAGIPVLFKVIDEGKQSVFEELLNFPGIDLNKFDERYADTPLMYAIYYGKTKMAQLLIEHDVDITLKNAKGINAHNQACYYENNEIKKLLEEKISNSKTSSSLKV